MRVVSSLRLARDNFWMNFDDFDVNTNIWIISSLLSFTNDDY